MDEWQTPEIAFRIEWEGLELESTCPPEHAASTLGLLGNELLRLNLALVAQGDSRAELESSSAPDEAVQRDAEG